MSSRKEKDENSRKWIQFYRANPHIFIEEYFGVELHFFQKLIIVLMHRYPIFVFLACRGISKTFTVAVYAIAMCVLYPGLAVVLTSGTAKQAKKIITDKVEKEFRKNYPAINREIKQVKTGEEPEVIFYNNSRIVSQPPNDNARGIRAKMLIFDESRMIPQEIIDKVFEPMKVSASRMISMKSETIGYEIEDIDNKSIYMTSGWYKSNWNWGRFVKIYNDMLNSFKNGTEPTGAIISMPYHIAIMAGLLKRADIIKARKETTPIDFLMEYEGEFFGESGNAFFKLEHFAKNRRNFKPYQLKKEVGSKIMGSDDKFSAYKDECLRKMPFTDGEIRIMAVDSAPSTSDGSDNNIVALARMKPHGDYYSKQIVNIKRMENDVSSELAILIKRWFYGFDCEEIALDAQGTSMALFDELIKETYDPVLDTIYPAWRVFDGNGSTGLIEDQQSRTRESVFDDVIYSINADDKFNHTIAMRLRAALEEGYKIELLPEREIGRDIITDSLGYSDPDEEAELLEPYIGTDNMITEAVLLEKVQHDRFIKLKQTGSGKKDRYIAVAYLNYLGTLWDGYLRDSAGEEEFIGYVD